MPRVVPGQVVAFINKVFVFNNRLALIDAQDSPQLTAIVELARAIPTELLTITGEDYAEYMVALGAIDFCLRTWISRGSVGGLSGVSGKSPVFIIREFLAKCPDEGPSATTTELAFVTEAALRQSIRLDISAANQDLVNGEWKGATVLAGSALEALLLSRRCKWPSRSKRARSRAPPWRSRRTRRSTAPRTRTSSDGIWSST
jgi:hypothetical protein